MVRSRPAGHRDTATILEATRDDWPDQSPELRRIENMGLLGSDQKTKTVYRTRRLDAVRLSFGVGKKDSAVTRLG